MRQTDRTLQEFRTTLPPAAVITWAKEFFTRRNSLYAAFPEREGEGYISFRGQGGEEIVIAAQPSDGATLVTGSTYLFDMQVARFFSTLPESPVQQAAPAATAAGPSETLAT